jgi:hypothetical protein
MIMGLTVAWVGFRWFRGTPFRKSESLIQGSCIWVEVSCNFWLVPVGCFFLNCDNATWGYLCRSGFTWSGLVTHHIFVSEEAGPVISYVQVCGSGTSRTSTRQRRRGADRAPEDDPRLSDYQTRSAGHPVGDRVTPRGVGCYVGNAQVLKYCVRSDGLDNIVVNNLRTKYFLVA